MQFVKTVLGERLSTVVRRRMCPDVGTFTLSLEERQKAVKKQYLLLFGLLTLLERPLFIFFFYLTGWATRAGGLVIAVLAVDALLQATGLLIWYQTGSTLAEELIITVFFYVFVSIVHCVTGGWTHGIWVGGLLIQPVMSSLFLCESFSSQGVARVADSRQTARQRRARGKRRSRSRRP